MRPAKRPKLELGDDAQCATQAETDTALDAVEDKMAFLSAEAQAIIAAINGNVDSRVNTLNTKLDTVSDKVDSLSGNVKDLEITTKAHGDRLKNLEEEMERLKNAGSSAASVASFASTRATPTSSTANSKSNRKTLIFGGFPPDTDGEEVEKFLKEKMNGIDTVHIHPRAGSRSSAWWSSPPPRVCGIGLRSTKGRS